MEKFISAEKIHNIKWNRDILYGTSDKKLFTWSNSDKTLRIYDEKYKESESLVLNDSYRAVFLIGKELLGITEDSTEIRIINIENSKIIAKTKLTTASSILAAVKHRDSFVLLDKNSSMLRVYDGELKEVNTIGSRLGYFKDYSYTGRLGFEMPEHMVEHEETILVSDSGNHRLVLISEDYKAVKAIVLPEAPYRIISFNGEVGAVLDFYNKVMFFSLSEGYLGSGKLEFSPDVYGLCSSASENRYIASEESDFYTVKADIGDIKALVFEGNTEFAELRLLFAENREKAEKYAFEKGQEYIYEFLRLGGVPQKNINECENFLKNEIQKSFEKIDSLLPDLFKNCHDFVVMYKSIPGYGDEEAAHIAMERIGAEAFEKIKVIRSCFSIISECRVYAEVDQLNNSDIKNLIDEKFGQYSSEYKRSREIINECMADLKEELMVKGISQFWIYREMMRTVFSDRSIGFDTYIPDIYLLEILRNFYYQTALIFYKNNKLEQFCFFSEKEIEMYVEKEGIFLEYIDKLVAMKEFDKIFDLFEKKPVRDKQGMNQQLARVYKEKHDYKNAFLSLKREFDLFPHKTGLLFDLAGYNMLSKAELLELSEKVASNMSDRVDVNYDVARALINAGIKEQGISYLNREIALFPENQKALILKLTILLGNNADEEELKYYAGLLNDETIEGLILKCRTFYVLKRYKECFLYMKKFLLADQDGTKSEPYLYLLNSLNYLSEDDFAIKEIEELKIKCRIEKVRKELDKYIEFISAESHADENLIDFSSYYSCGISALKKAVNAADISFREGNYEIALELVEGILNTHPGDRELLGLLKKYCTE